jgi:hypothetical protein
MICPSCSVANKGHARFCVGCGAALQVVPGSQAQPASPQVFTGDPVSTLSTRRTGKPLAALGWVLAALITAGALAASFYFLTASTKLVTSYETIPFKTETKTDAQMLEGVDYVQSPGKNGTRQVRTKIWTDETGNVTKSKVAWRRELTAPTPEVHVTGARAEYDVLQDVSALADQYMQAWQAADYGGMIALCAPDTLRGHDPAEVTAGYEVTRDTLETYALAGAQVAGTQQLLTSTGTSSGTEMLIPAEYPFGAAAIGYVGATYSTSSPMLGSANVDGPVRAAFTDGKWQIVYSGQLAARRVDLAERVRSSSWGGDSTVEVAIDCVILYPDSVALVVHETNLTRGKNAPSSADSQFSSLKYSGSGVLADDSPTATQYTVDGERSSDFGSIEQGQTQRGVMYFTPGVPTDATQLSLALPDTAFPAIPIP